MSLSSLDAAKQAARQALAVAGDKYKLATATLTRAETQDLDVAIIKATTPAAHVVPKDKHVRTLRAAVGAGAPRAQVAYVNGELLARLRGAADWLTALKTLMVFHRLMRECDSSYLDELLKLPPAPSSSASGRAAAAAARAARGGAGAPVSRFGMDGWVDATTLDGKFEFSEYVRGLARYLDAALGAHEAINWCPCGDGGGPPAGGGFAAPPSPAPAPASRFASLAAPDLLHQLPIVQRLLLRLADCAPAGPAAADPIVQASLLAVVKESFRAYRAASEGLINLADRFFDMDAGDAAGALDAYRQAGHATARLQAFYRAAEALPGLRGGVQFPRLEPPPADFVRQMEEYAASAPRALGEAGAGGGGAAAAAAAAAPAAGAAPLRRGRLAPPARASVLGAGGAGLPPVAAPAAAAAGGGGGADLIGDLLAAPAADPPAPAAAAAAPPPFDPFALSEAAPAFEAAAAAAAAPAPAPAAPAAPAPAAPARNPFADDAPSPFPPAPAFPTASAPPATPAGFGAWGGGGVSPSPSTPSVGGAASAPAAPPPPADPFADLVGGLSLGPGPRATPPLRAMAPPAGRPMSADRAA